MVEGEVSSLEGEGMETVNLRIEGNAHEAMLRIQQQEIILELKELVSAVDAVRYRVEHQTLLMDRTIAVLEQGLRTVSLVPVTICFLSVISWFFWKDKLSENWFVALLFFLALPHLHEFLEKGMRVFPVFGELLSRRGNGNGHSAETKGKGK